MMPIFVIQINKFTEISDCGESVEMLEACGILLDSEADAEAESGDAEPMSRQLFCGGHFQCGLCISQHAGSSKSPI